MNKNSAVIAGLAALALTVTGCSGKSTSTGASAATGGSTASAAAPAGGKLTIGFSQVGAESGWRAANTKDIKEAADKAGVTLKFSDAQGKQENQITAIRGYIADKVDVIAFSPVVTTGWDTVLQEAKAAKIPVVLTDRSVDSKDTSLYASFLGSDFVKEGEKAGAWLLKDVGDKPTNVVILEGSPGAAPAIDRNTGFKKAIEGHANIKILASQTGQFTRADGKQVMASFLQKYGDDINVLYAHNDDMGLGAIEAIEAAGKVPGKDIKIITVDAVKDGMKALSDGKINYIVECSPLLGGQLMDIAKKVKAGEKVDQRILTVESEFDQTQAKAVLADRKY